MNRLDVYMSAIPTSKKDAVDYSDLCYYWCCKPRSARTILHDLSLYDDGTDYVLIRSTEGGFYRTTNRSDILAYRKQVYNRGRNVFACLKKIDRVLNGYDMQYSINNIALYRQELGMSMQDLCDRLQGFEISAQMLAKLEDGTIYPSKPLLAKLSEILGVCEEDILP